MVPYAAFVLPVWSALVPGIDVLIQLVDWLLFDFQGTDVLVLDLLHALKDIFDARFVTG